MMNWLLSSLDKAPRFKAFEKHIKDIQENIYTNPELSIELSKTLIEGVFKTILYDKGENIPERFTNLIPETLNGLNLSEHSDVERINTLFKRLNGILDYINELRGDCSYASHGQDREHIKLTSDLALFVANVTNAVLGFIIHLYIESVDYAQSSRMCYEDYEEFNNFLDQYYDEIIGDTIISKIKYSEALYSQDKEAYKDEYNEYLKMKRELAEDTL